MANGVIKRLVSDKGFGFIAESEGGSAEYFFHHSALVGVRFDEVHEGMRVSFEPGQNAKGLRAEAVRVAA